MSREPNTLDEIDYWDLDLFVDGDPHAAWKLQREQAPVMWHDRPGGEPFWSVTTYDLIKSVYADPHVYSSQANGIMLRDADLLAAPPNEFMERNPPMIHTDPPRHAPLRKVLSHNFTPQAIARLEDQLRGFAAECMEEAADKGEVDFVTDIAHRIPAAITFALMDIPRDRWARLAQIQHLQVTRTETEFWEHEEKSLDEVSMEMYGYFFEVCSHRMEHPGDDLLSQVVQGVVEGEQLGVVQGVAEAGLLLAGGLDTTRAAASAGAMVPLLEHPDQLAALQADPSLLPGAIEEFVRWASPITHEARTVMSDTELGGHQLSAGDRVAVWSPSANRDTAYFDDPFTYDIRRSPNRHLGFAWGEHYCLGVHLAKLTLRVEFEELFRRFSAFELTAEPKRVRSNFVGGLVHLPMRLTPR
ncbi:MAG: cytochrome P450 [Acidimicrobiales bacterium]|nr:cytochrome P450 [Acidimicrobiales bacterium]